MSTPHYDIHVFICQNQREPDATRECCKQKGSDKLLEYMKAAAKKLSIPRIRINKSGCLNECERGVAVVVYPAGIWYSIKTTKDEDRLVEKHFLNKIIVSDLSMQ